MDSFLDYFRMWVEFTITNGKGKERHVIEEEIGQDQGLVGDGVCRSLPL